MTRPRLPGIRRHLPGIRRLLPGVRRLLRRMSLRARLLCLSVALVAVGLLATGVVVSTQLHGYLQDRVDDRLVLTGQIASRIPEPARTAPKQPVRTLGIFGNTTIGYLDDGGTARRTFDSGSALPGGGPELPELDRGTVESKGG